MNRPTCAAQPVSIEDTIPFFFDGDFDGYFNLTKTDMVALVSFEKSFMLDGIPILQKDPNPKGVTFALEFPSTLSKNFSAGVSFCAPFHYDHAIYDPSVTILFASPVDSPQAIPPKEARNRKTAIIVGSVIGALVIVAIAVVIALTIYVPSVRHFFQPFSQVPCLVLVLPVTLELFCVAARLDDQAIVSCLGASIVQWNIRSATYQ